MSPLEMRIERPLGLGKILHATKDRIQLKYMTPLILNKRKYTNCVRRESCNVYLKIRSKLANNETRC